MTIDPTAMTNHLDQGHKAASEARSEAESSEPSGVNKEDPRGAPQGARSLPE
jgi:hypothetical protein